MVTTLNFVSAHHQFVVVDVGVSDLIHINVMRKIDQFIKNFGESVAREAQLRHTES